MQTTRIPPGQIIALNDYPLHDNKVLVDYFNKSKAGQELPLIPVMRKRMVKKYFSPELYVKFKEFEDAHPEAGYFMIDGSHRTTALALAERNILVIIYESDKDIAEAKIQVILGKVLESNTLNLSIKENCEVLAKHFEEKPYFMSVKQKTKKMIADDVLPPDLFEKAK